MKIDHVLAGKKLTVAMKKKGIKNKDLAQMFNVDPAQVTKWKNGASSGHLTFKMLVIIRDTVFPEYDMSYFLGQTEYENFKKRLAAASEIDTAIEYFAKQLINACYKYNCIMSDMDYKKLYPSDNDIEYLKDFCHTIINRINAEIANYENLYENYDGSAWDITAEIEEYIKELKKDDFSLDDYINETE